MKSVFDNWPEIAAKIQQHKSVFLALDYDGVLAPIAPNPDLAVLPPANRALMEQLAKSPRVRMAIVSGRSVSDVRSHIGISEIVYAGNHGSEIDANGVREFHAGEDFRPQLLRMFSQLREVFAGIPGVLLEDKGFGIGLHYREVDPSNQPIVAEKFRTWSAKLPDNLVIAHAKMMYEVRPKQAWNKGNAVWHLWQSAGPSMLPICLGDDLTDEDGFRALLGKGVSIYVGEERQSYADYILHSQGDVTGFLARLLAEVGKGNEATD